MLQSMHSLFEVGFSVGKKSSCMQQGKALSKMHMPLERLESTKRCYKAGTLWDLNVRTLRVQQKQFLRVGWILHVNRMGNSIKHK